MCLITSFAIKFYSAKVKGRFFRLLFAEAVVVEVETVAVDGFAASILLTDEVELVGGFEL